MILSAAGAAAGASLGGAVLGVSSAVIGRALGATLGRPLDERLFGYGGSGGVSGRIERYRITGAAEAEPIPLIYGRYKVPGHVIWSTRLKESIRRSGGGKGTARGGVTKSASYSVSLACALCEGEALRIGRVWIDGAQVPRADLDLRFYPGSETQEADPLIAAVEGTHIAPSYRGLAYVVIEDLDLAAYGNRIPQFHFEVFRPATREAGDLHPRDLIRAVALVPGSGEYALATTPLHFREGPGRLRSANIHNREARPDIEVALDAMIEELPNLQTVSLIVSWYGDDLRCDRCTIRPMVDQAEQDAEGMAWSVSGSTRATAPVISRIDGRPAFGGTPTDQSVIQAIAAIKARGLRVTFYPFMMMDVPGGNDLVDPWTGVAPQPDYPWRGRMTTALAPDQVGTSQATAAANTEVASFFGTISAAEFTSGSDTVQSASAEWSYRRFILHYAHLCALAGGVDSFLIGSEMRSLTQIRADADTFPAVTALKSLLGDARGVLGAGVKLGYAADWSEYAAFHPNDGSGDVFFHLDPFWSDPDCDFIGIDNYMPLSDWRDGDSHLDAGYGHIGHPDYLRANVAGGEGFDWFYANQSARDLQLRTPIIDTAHGEDWVFRHKDVASWWAFAHHDRPGGVRAASSTAWVPSSKPVRFTEYGCPAVAFGTNQPNVFVDPKSSESALPHYSSGRADPFIQLQYLSALLGYWGDAANNPVSAVYGGPMIDLDESSAWAWDARPWPEFPNDLETWSDGANHRLGHWLTGRIGNETLGAVIKDIARRGGVTETDTSQVPGVLQGFARHGTGTARAAIEQLALAYGLDARQEGGALAFFARNAVPAVSLDSARLAVTPEEDGKLHRLRQPAAEISGRLRLTHTDADGSYELRVSEAVEPGDKSDDVSGVDLPVLLSASEGRLTAGRLLSEARGARNRLNLALPPSRLDLAAGEVFELDGATYRVIGREMAEALRIEAVLVDRASFSPGAQEEDEAQKDSFAPPLAVELNFLDLPISAATDQPHAPYVAAAAVPWPEAASLYRSTSDDDYAFDTLISRPAIIGETLNELNAAAAGIWDRSSGLRVQLADGDLLSADASAVLNGANLAAVGDGTPDGWEIIAFTGANLVDARTYDLTGLLRGLYGTENVIQDRRDPGARFVLLDEQVGQTALPAAERGLARHYRYGPARRGVDDPSFQHAVHAISGLGLRPLAPAHLRRAGIFGNDIDFEWIRRTRIDGDSWLGLDVPLGETSEAYLIQITQAGVIKRTSTVTAPAWTYAAAAQSQDGITLPFDVEIAQISDRFGPGVFKRITIDG